MIETIEEAQDAAPTLYQAIALVIFHQDASAFLPSVLPGGEEWPAFLMLPDTAHTAHTAPELTDTAAPDPATPVAGRSSKINSNRLRPTNGQTASPSLPVNLDSDVTLVASIGESDGDSDYVESAENSPTSPANTPDLGGHISELEEMHEVVEGELDVIAQPTVIFSRIEYLETGLPENHQDNGATP